MNLYHIENIDGPEECYMWAPSHDDAYYAAVCTNAMRNALLGNIRVRQVLAFFAFDRFIPWQRDNPRAHEARLKPQ